MSSSTNDQCSDFFNIKRFDSAINNVLHSDIKSTATAGTGVLISGDFNAHHSLWDTLSHADKHGKALEKFLSKNNFLIANDGQPTFHTSKAKTAVDITSFSGDIVVENWHHSQPLGTTHHDILIYDVVAVEAELLTLHSTNNSANSMLTLNIAWKKVDYSQFNLIVEKV